MPVKGLHPGKFTTDDRDTFVIAHTVCRESRWLRRLILLHGAQAEMSMFLANDGNLVRQFLAATDRLRGLLAQMDRNLDTALLVNFSQKAIPSSYPHFDMPEKDGVKIGHTSWPKLAAPSPSSQPLLT